MWKSEWPVLHRLASDQLAWLKHKSTTKAAFLFLCVSFTHSHQPKEFEIQREVRERERERERKWQSPRPYTHRWWHIFPCYLYSHCVHPLLSYCKPFPIHFFCLFVCLFLRRKMRNGFWCVMGCDLNFKRRDVRVIPESHWSFDFLFVSMKTLFLAKTFT